MKKRKKIYVKFLICSTVMGAALLGFPCITKIASATETVTEDPFNYQGEYVIDSNKLTEQEKAALSYIEKYAKGYNISPALIMAIIKKESNFNPKAIGDDGNAIGYMQVWWIAAKQAGYPGTEEEWKRDGLDPDTNIKYGAKYLKWCYETYNDKDVYPNDPLKNTISAYNAGHPTRKNETSYVNPVLTYYEDYKTKYVQNFLVTVQPTWQNFTKPNESHTHYITIKNNTKDSKTAHITMKLIKASKCISITKYPATSLNLPAKGEAMTSFVIT